MDEDEADEPGVLESVRQRDGQLRILRWIAVVAGIFWVLNVLLSAWANWDLSAGGGWFVSGPGVQPPTATVDSLRLRTTVLGAVTAGAPYLLVFTVAIGLLVHFDRPPEVGAPSEMQTSDL